MHRVHHDPVTGRETSIDLSFAHATHERLRACDDAVPEVDAGPGGLAQRDAAAGRGERLHDADRVRVRGCLPRRRTSCRPRTRARPRGTWSRCRPATVAYNATDRIRARRTRRSVP